MQTLSDLLGAAEEDGLAVTPVNDTIDTFRGFRAGATLDQSGLQIVQYVVEGNQLGVV